VAVYLISLRVQVFEDRYLIYITPAFYLVVVSGLLRVRHYTPLGAALGLGLLLMINGAGLWQQRLPIKADFRAAAAYLAARPEPPTAIMVQMPYLQRTLDYYYPNNDYIRLEGLWTNDNKTEAVVDQKMQELTTNLSDLWLVVSEEETWDQRHLTRRWLDEHAMLVEKAHFARVDLYYYYLPSRAILAPPY
jgi:hypothetical protein